MVGTYSVGMNPFGVAFDGTHIWVANAGGNTVTELLAATGATVGTYSVGMNPIGVAFDGTNIWVTNGGSNTVTKIGPASPQAEAPAITSLVPNSVFAGGSALTLTVNGSGFLAGSVVQLNSSSLVTTYVSGNQLTASVSANLIAKAGSASVTVLNPGGGRSNALTFTINASPPTLSSLSPISATAGGPAFMLTVNGSGFANGAVVQWNGSPLSTNFSGTQLTASVPASLIANPGTANVTVVNPNGMGSNAIAFAIRQSLSPPINVTNDASFTTQISPGSLVALFGNGNILATTTVSGFNAPLPNSANGTSVTINGFLCPLVYVSASQVNLQAPMELQPGTAAVVVNNNGKMFSTTVQVLTAAPGIFTTDYYANGGVAILQDSATGTVLNVNHPAVPGQNVTMYFTGVGPITNNPGTGNAAPLSPLSQSTSTVGVTVNGIFVQPSFTGLTPGFAGLGQVNFPLPANTPSGNTIPVVLTINGVNSKTVQISVN